ncbi:hypothetical protein IF1G_10905 [Cordyceps javanica]|uniref:Uncharacterized protein n=1 Tax=Cordyceps javanica TaxID=43265 RepID=A0A545ULT2_9HYPO|nr:hypothetical protein IF1G_10905 [Cordyceps javanica]
MHTHAHTCIYVSIYTYSTSEEEDWRRTANNRKLSIKKWKLCIDSLCARLNLCRCPDSGICCLQSTFALWKR